MMKFSCIPHRSWIVFVLAHHQRFTRITSVSYGYVFCTQVLDQYPIQKSWGITDLSLFSCTLSTHLRLLLLLPSLLLLFFLLHLPLSLFSNRPSRTEKCEDGKWLGWQPADESEGRREWDGGRNREDDMGSTLRMTTGGKEGNGETREMGKRGNGGREREGWLE